MNRNYWGEYYQVRQTSLSKDYDGWLSVYEKHLQPGSRVLDLGCGAGTDVETLLKLGVKLTAADLSPDAVRMVREAFGASLDTDCFDVREGFPYNNESFDVVVSDLSLHYFSWNDTVKIVSELERILAPEGRIIARLHSVDNLGPEAGEMIEENYYVAYGYSRRYFTEGDVRRLFADWNIVSFTPAVARRYNREKKVFEFTAVRRSK